MSEAGRSDNVFRLPWADVTDETNQDDPHDEIAERALLGTLLLKNDVYEQVAETLHPDHFYYGLNGRLYAEIARRIVNRSGVTPNTLKAWIDADPDGREQGGFAYIKVLMRSIDGTNVKPHVDSIHRCWVCREAIGIANRLIEIARDPKADIQDALVSTADQIDGVTLEQDGPATRSFDDAVREAFAQVEKGMQRGGKPTLPIVGFPKLNDALLLEPGKITFLAGESGEGKSALAFQLAVDIAEWVQSEGQDGRPVEAGGVVLVSLEMSGAAIAIRQLARMAAIDSKRIARGCLTEAEFAEDLEVAKNRLLGLPIEVIDGYSLTPSQIRARCKQAQRRLMRHHNTRIGLIVLDHLQHIEGEEKHARGGGAWVTTKNARGLLDITKSMNCHTLALTQITRPPDKKGDPDWEPTGDNMAWAGAIRQVADALVIMRRPEAHLPMTSPVQEPGDPIAEFDSKLEKWERDRKFWKGKALLILAKVRDGVAGESIQMSFQAQTTSFDETSWSKLDEVAGRG